MHTERQQGLPSKGCGDALPMATLLHFPECLNKLEQQCDILKKYEVEGTKLLTAGGENEKIIIT